ncbi:glycoside hydrolase family 30 protein [Haloplasma contractile]|uniref:Glucosylceramidase protein n=1 Tax=Haloplasma contractile SSD-17B TaxID=1033810 RepID=U2FE20_9MOLU|nr:glycoside hydrolase family 30 beta sandwich domain-containing protein [Haloplasma contractile]ERJ11220.1 glucosylceramidase protein [Haloplasma contractile SSD-17B]
MTITKIIILNSVMITLILLTACGTNNEAGSTTQITSTEKIISEERLEGNIDVDLFTTTGDQSKLLQKQESLELALNLENRNLNKVKIDDRIIYQVMDGFGAALTESSAYLIDEVMTGEQKETLLTDLFSQEGINLSFVRIQMGASDFALDSYTYNDLPLGQTDPNLEHFSIERDRRHVIPVLKRAKALNNDLYLMGTPWSMPAWMKDSETLNGSRLSSDYYDPFANYFVKFIKAYEEEGLPIYAVTLQNEPLHETSHYPSMKMPVNQQTHLIKHYVGPTFESNNIDTKIIAYDHNWSDWSYPNTVLNDQEAREYVAGTAFHCYEGDVEEQQYINNSHPDKGIWFTECSAGAWSTNFKDNLNWNLNNIFFGSIEHHSKAVLLWNLALDENNGPTFGGCSNCRGVVTINSQDGSYTKNVEYYLLAHFSKYVENGAVRIDSTSTNRTIKSLAFRNPDGSTALIVHNNSSRDTEYEVNYKGAKFLHTIEGNSITSFIWNEWKQ